MSEKRYYEESRFLYEKRKYYCGHCLRGSCPLCHRDLSRLSESSGLRYRSSGAGTLAGDHCGIASDLLCRTDHRNPDDEKEDLPELPMWTPGTKRVYISMVILLVYMLVLSTVGFIIPSVIMLFAFCQWFHRGAIWKNAVISIAVILVIYFVFKNFLNVPIDFGMFSI
ncbi:tripartite tricarboxylate transporter TctB family protein [Clostridium sp. AM45-5]|nr:tripartite tricarboxylate transporter TctB family protein [Clostridium sp. AM45-5]